MKYAKKYGTLPWRGRGQLFEQGVEARKHAQISGRWATKGPFREQKGSKTPSEPPPRHAFRQPAGLRLVSKREKSDLRVPTASLGRGLRDEPPAVVLDRSSERILTPTICRLIIFVTGHECTSSIR